MSTIKRSVRNIGVLADELTVIRGKSIQNREELVNNFLDDVIKLQKSLKEYSNSINKMTSLLEQASWCSIKSKTDEEEIKDLIELANIFYKSMIKSYTNELNIELIKKCANKQLINVKCTIDDFGETIIGIKEVFFVLPKDENFQKALNNLKELHNTTS